MTRADPAVVALIELAGLWVAACDWPALLRTLHRLDDAIGPRFPDEAAFAARFRALHHLIETTQTPLAVEQIRGAY